MSARSHVFHYPEDRRSVGFVALALGLLALQWSGTLRHPVLWTGSVLFCLVGCIVNHNHQHHPTFRSPALNRLFGLAISLVTGQPATAIVPMHNENHHVHGGGPEDLIRPDLAPGWGRFMDLLVFPLFVLRGYLPVKHAHLRSWRERCPRLYRQLQLERAVFLTVLVAALWTDPGATLVYLGGPWLLAQWCLISINYLQHAGCDPDSVLDHSQNVTGRVLNWLFLNNGYHTAHHERPGLHWTRLPGLHARIASGIPPERVQPSLLALLRADGLRGQET